VILFLLSDEWLMFDDDEVTAVHSEDILRLSGGGKRSTIIITLHLNFSLSLITSSQYFLTIKLTSILELRININ
jgi:hypothetical protein